MKIVRLEAENFKRLRAVTIEPGPGSGLVVVGGGNGHGKSSTLDAIEAALGGKKRAPKDPIRHGEKKARIVAETESLIISRTFTSSSSRLEVTPKVDGALPLPTPQAVLDELVGSLSFDPLEFGRMDGAKQVKVLRELAGIDLSAIDTEIQSHEISRRDCGRDLKKAEARLAAMPPVKKSMAIVGSVSEIVAELERREVHNRANADLRDDLARKRQLAKTVIEGLDSISAKIAAVERELEDLRRQQSEAAARLESIRSDGKELADRVAGLVDEDTAAIKAQLVDAEKAVGDIAKAKERGQLELEVSELRSRYDNLDAGLQSARLAKAQAIEQAQYPIPGLEARDDGVYLAGVPWSQASSAEALRASVAIGLSLNPQLRVLLIRDGSLLDDDSLAMIAEMAQGADAQLWIERVGKGKEVTVVIEDGEANHG